MTHVNAAKAGAVPSERIHALDGLRTTMLLLVVLYHCLLSYVAAPSRNWPFKDVSTTIAADMIIRFVHAFTLPTFFIMAGFFPRCCT